MAMKKLGIGIQTIRDFSEENRIYVDKTEKIYELMELLFATFINSRNCVQYQRFTKPTRSDYEIVLTQFH